MKDYGMSEKNAGILTGNKHFAQIFEETIALGADVTETTNWLMGHTLYLMGEKGVEADDLSIQPTVFAKFEDLIVSGRLNRTMGKEVFEKVFEGDPDFDVEGYIKENNLEAISDDSQVGAVVKEVLDAHMDLVADYKAGDEKLYGFFIGQCMMKLKGKASPALVNRLVKEEIERR